MSAPAKAAAVRLAKIVFRPAKGPITRSMLFRRAMRLRHLSKNRPRWSFSGAESAAPERDGAGLKILLGTNIGGYLNGLSMESTLAQALLLRGHNVHVLLCDSVLPACLECTHERLGSTDEMADHGPRKTLCPGCFSTGRQTYGEVGATVHNYSSLLTADDRAEARAVAASVTPANVAELTIDGLRLGEHALAGTLRFFARATIDDEPRATEVLRRYTEASVLTARAVGRLLESGRFDVAVFHHGIYVPQGIFGEVCRRAGVRVVNWNPAYRSQTFIFSHDDTYHHTLLDEPNEVWESFGWDDAREQHIMDYLKSRWTGARDWIWFHERPEADIAVIERELGIDLSKPTIGMLTNVMWDAQLHYAANAFENMNQWVIQTIGWFERNPQLQLLIRVHPAEITGTVTSRQRVQDEIRKVFPNLPANVFVAGPESRISTYAAMAACDSAIIYGTKTGVELAAMGIPVIVAGEAWIRGKGVSIDVSSPAEYVEVLSSLPLGRRMPEDQVRRARQYAYHFFFRRMIPLEFMWPTGGDPVFRPDVPSADALLPGRSPGLDVVVKGITERAPFVFPADSADVAG